MSEGPSVTATLADRRKTHGDFKEMAITTQSILAELQQGSSYALLSFPQREALHMIVHKMARITSGDPDHRDSWLDIAGYAQLIVKELDNEDV